MKWHSGVKNLKNFWNDVTKGTYGASKAVVFFQDRWNPIESREGKNEADLPLGFFVFANTQWKQLVFTLFTNYTCYLFLLNNNYLVF